MVKLLNSSFWKCNSHCVQMNGCETIVGLTAYENGAKTYHFSTSKCLSFKEIHCYRTEGAINYLLVSKIRKIYDLTSKCIA